MTIDTSSNSQVAASAALASVATKSLLHPIDTVKCRLQSADHGRGARAFLSHWKGQWRFRDLYRGLPVKVALYGPYQSIYMTSYNASKRHIDTTMPKWASVCVSSLVADCVSAVVRIPMEAVKVRLQASEYSNSADAVRRIKASGTRPLVRLFVPQIVIHDVPYGFAQWICYEYFTPVVKRYLPFKQSERADSVAASLVAGCLSGCVAGAITIPLDVIKTKTIVRNASSETWISATSVAKEIYARNGVRGFSRGVTARVLWISANVGVYFSLFEAFKSIV